MARRKLSDMTLDQLYKEIQRRLRVLPKLIARRDELNGQIAELESLAKAVESRRPARKAKPGLRAKRYRNKTSLPEVIAAVLKGKEAMGVGDIAQAVRQAGYRSTSKSFRSLVNKALITDKRFRNVRRGRYAMKA